MRRAAAAAQRELFMSDNAAVVRKRHDLLFAQTASAPACKMRVVASEVRGAQPTKRAVMSPPQCMLIRAGARIDVTDKRAEQPLRAGAQPKRR